MKLKLMSKLKPYISVTQATWLLLLLITLLHLLIAGRVGLSDAESNYALYGVHLQLSYFDHPPLVGWLQAIVIPFAHSDFAMRLWPMVINIGWSWTLFQLAKTLFTKENPWLPFISVAITQSAIVLNVLGVALLPQAPFLLFALLAILFLYRAIESERLGNFILLGLCLGLAALSEYTAILLVVVVVLYVITSKWQLLFSYKLWLSGIIAIILSLPVFYWNCQHHWISFHYQTGHVLSQQQNWSLWLFLYNQLLQFFAYSPGIYIFGLLATTAAFSAWKDHTTRLLVLLILVILFFFAYAAGYKAQHPHWTAVAWVGSSILSARYLCHHWQKIWVKLGVYFSLAYSLVIILLLHFYIIFSVPKLPIDKNPFIALQGWQQAASVGKSLAQVKRLRLLFTPRRIDAIIIAWYSNMPVKISKENTVVSQQSLWYGQPTNGDDGILIIPYSAATPATTGTKPGEFKHCDFLKLLNIKKHQQLINQFKFYSCYGYIGK